MRAWIVILALNALVGFMRLRNMGAKFLYLRRGWRTFKEAWDIDIIQIWIGVFTVLYSWILLILELEFWLVAEVVLARKQHADEKRRKQELNRIMKDRLFNRFGGIT